MSIPLPGGNGGPAANGGNAQDMAGLNPQNLMQMVCNLLKKQIFMLTHKTQNYFYSSKLLLWMLLNHKESNNLLLLHQRQQLHQLLQQHHPQQPQYRLHLHPMINKRLAKTVKREAERKHNRRRLHKHDQALMFITVHEDHSLFHKCQLQHLILCFHAIPTILQDLWEVEELGMFFHIKCRWYQFLSKYASIFWS